MSETRKLAAILVADIVGFSRLAGADEDRILARLRTLRSDLIDPLVAVHDGRTFKRTGDGSIVEFRSVVAAVRCAIEIQDGLAERNAGVLPERRIEFRIGVHLGDVVEEADGDLMGDGVNIAARLEGVAKPGAICLSEDAYRQVKARLDLKVSDLGPTRLKNIAEPMHVYLVEVNAPWRSEPIRESQRSPAVAATPRRARWRSVTAAAALAIAAFAAGYAPWSRLASQAFGPTSSADMTAKSRSLSVISSPLVETNNGDLGQAYFANNMRRDPAGDLSLPNDRSTGNSLPSEVGSLADVERELNALRAQEIGTSQVSGSVPTNTRLFWTEMGAHVWSGDAGVDSGRSGGRRVEYVVKWIKTLRAEVEARQPTMMERPESRAPLKPAVFDELTSPNQPSPH